MISSKYMDRKDLTDRISAGLKRSPVVALVGPRQSGKTTIARWFVTSEVPAIDDRLNYFDLENPVHLDRLTNPLLALQPLRGLVVIDEVQRRPDLFPLLRVLVDRDPSPAQFLVLGNASRDLLRQGSESLAGRIEFVDVLPFWAGESGTDSLDRLWIRGGYPRSFLAADDEASWVWRENYVRTFLERDIPALGFRIPPMALRRFWMMVAHYHGQAFNAAEMATSLGVADTTVGRYLDLLAGTFMVRRVPPWFENIGKRQVKRPKIYFRDSGIYHRLMDVRDRGALENHPKLGCSWEGFAVEQVIRSTRASDEEVFFWGVHGQGELDLLVFSGGRRTGFEVKYTDRPTLTPALRLALAHLRLDELIVVVPGDVDYPLGEKVRVRGLARVVSA
jgi:predicted AAA+ superfamily ATPase